MPLLTDALDPKCHLGPVDPTTMLPKGPRTLTEDEKRTRNARENMLPLDAMINLNAIEDQAENVLSWTACAHCRSAANGEDSKLSGIS
ncbi:hypothetical protein QFC19_000165 [Naganishia cerealis]|uniref:Uncharacterized protein n=1 Tax=Naganishia cerealis TaxID=610337 RepID=A0ACC2WS34_9TREE|nr:hypothetical protein QFC19_000165 [Naganishia cerealis]